MVPVTIAVARGRHRHPRTWGVLRGRSCLRGPDLSVLRRAGGARRAGVPVVSVESVVALVAAVTLAGYLLWALLKPERF